MAPAEMAMVVCPLLFAICRNDRAIHLEGRPRPLLAARLRSVQAPDWLARAAMLRSAATSSVSHWLTWLIEAAPRSTALPHRIWGVAGS